MTISHLPRGLRSYAWATLWAVVKAMLMDCLMGLGHALSLRILAWSLGVHSPTYWHLFVAVFCVTGLLRGAGSLVTGRSSMELAEELKAIKERGVRT